jgi:hypothetical protein
VHFSIFSEVEDDKDILPWQLIIGKKLKNQDGSITYEYEEGFGQTYKKQMNFCV